MYIISIINKYAEKAVSLLLLFKEREPFARLWDFDAAEHDRTFGLRPPGNQDQTFIFPPYCVFWKEEIGGGWFVVSNTIQVSLYFISAVLMLPLAGNFQVIVWKRYFAKFRQTSNKYHLFLLINYIIFFDQILQFSLSKYHLFQIPIITFFFTGLFYFWGEYNLKPVTSFRGIIPSSWFSVSKSLRHQRNRLSWLNF